MTGGRSHREAETEGEDVNFLVVGGLHGALPRIPPPDKTGKLPFDAILTPGDFCSGDAIRKARFFSIHARQEGKDVAWCDVIGKREASAHEGGLPGRKEGTRASRAS